MLAVDSLLEPSFGAAREPALEAVVDATSARRSECARLELAIWLTSLLTNDASGSSICLSGGMRVRLSEHIVPQASVKLLDVSSNG